MYTKLYAMRISIITPEQIILDCEARQVIVPGTKSPFAMLDKHQAIISSLLPEGEIKISKSDGTELRVRIEGNCIVEQHDNIVSVLATKAKIEQ